MWWINGSFSKIRQICVVGCFNFLMVTIIVMLFSTSAVAGQIGKVKVSGKTEQEALENGIRMSAVKVLKKYYGFGPAHPISKRISGLPIDVLSQEVISLPPKGRIKKRRGSFSGKLKFSSNDNGLEAFVVRTVSKFLEDAYIQNVGAVFTFTVTAGDQNLSAKAKKNFIINLNEELRTVMGKYGVKLRALPPNLVKFLSSLSSNNSAGNEYMENIQAAVEKMETSEKGRVDVIVFGNIDIHKVEPNSDGGVYSHWFLKGRVIENIAGKSPDQQNQHNLSVDGGGSYGDDFKSTLHTISLEAAYRAVADGVLSKLTVPESITKRLVVRLCGSVADSNRAKMKISKALKKVRGAGEFEKKKNNTVFTLSNSKHEDAMELYEDLESVFEKLNVEPEIIGNALVVGDTSECEGVMQAVKKSQPADADDLHIVLSEVAKEVVAKVKEQKGRNATAMLLHMNSRQGKVQCDPLSRLLMTKFRGTMEKEIKKRRLGIGFIDDNDDWNQDVVALVGEWDNQGRGRIGFKVIVASEAGETSVDKAFKAQSLSEQSQRCLLSTSDVSKEFSTKRKITVLDSPNREATKIDEFPRGKHILVDARIKDTPWKIVRLPDDDNLPVGMRERRGFIYATTGRDGDIE
jgi:hypothetical protein